jgi:Tfp pilus assembly protein PilO
MKYTDCSKQNTLAIALVIICVVGIYNWFIVPQTRYLAAAQKYQEMVDSREKLGKIMSGQTKFRHQELDKLTRQLEQEKQAFFDANEAKSFLEDIQSIEKKHGCQVLNLKFSPSNQIAVKDNNSIDIYQDRIDMNLMGNYKDIVKFLNIIQSKTARVWVEAMSVSTRQDKTNYLNCNITLNIYTLKIKENASHVENKQI